MPKVKYLSPLEQLALEEELRERYGGMMTAADVGRELGNVHQETYRSWLSDIPAVTIGKRKKWRVCDVAKKIYMNMVVERS